MLWHCKNSVLAVCAAVALIGSPVAQLPNGGMEAVHFDPRTLQIKS